MKRRQEELSEVERWALKGPEAVHAWLSAMTKQMRQELPYHWQLWARPAQIAPTSPKWRTWLIMAGRGFGKTRAGAEWVRTRAERDGKLRIALVGATIAEARAVMVEGASGLMTIAPPWNRPDFEPSLKRLQWRNGAQAFLYSASEPEGLRGPEHHLAWGDEIAKWPHGIATWDNLWMGLRQGSKPRAVVTTTPRPTPLVRRLVAADDATLTRGRTGENRSQLASDFIVTMKQTYGGTRLGRQELDGELIEEVEGALWTRELIERSRAVTAPPLVRVVIGVDPPAGEGGDACGIVVAGLAADGVAYLIEDASVERAAPERWAQAVRAAAARHEADRVVAEANNGGAMVGSVLRAGDCTLPVRLVHASRGKAARAEPVSVLYHDGKVRHVGAFPQLEDEMCGLIAGGGYEGPGRSPDRADAAVWALTELMLGRRTQPGVRVV